MTKAETEHEKALRKAERASKEQNEHLQEKLSFYKELEEMSGAFGLSLEVQNRLLDEQMEIFRDADIPENLIQTWRQYKDLMNSHDWADGAQRRSSSTGPTRPTRRRGRRKPFPRSIPAWTRAGSRHGNR